MPAIDVMDKNLKPTIILITAILSVSVSSILIRLCATPPLVIAFYRQSFCLLFFLPFIGRDRRPVLSRRDYFLLAVSGFFLALHFATWISSLSYTTVAHATLFVDLQPVWAAVLGTLFLRETLGPLEILAVAVVTTGGVLIMGTGWAKPGGMLIGDLLALAGGMAGAVYLLIGRFIRHRISWARYMYSVYYISAAWLLVFSILFHGRLPYAELRDLPLLIVMALVPGIGGHGLMNLSLRHFKAYVVNTALLGEPVLATIFALFLFHEVPEAYFYAGAFFVIAGLVAVFRLQKTT